MRRPAFFIVFLLAVALAVNALSYSNFDPSYGFLRLKQKAIATGWYLPAYYAHVLVSAAILIVGFFQVSNTVRMRWRKVHRLLGKLYVFGVLCLAAPGGLIMSFFIGRGLIVQASFLAQVTLWFYFTWMAYIKAKQQDFVAHEVWMYRSFALTLAAITLRLYAALFSFQFDMGQPGVYATIAWTSWGLNLLAVEWWFRNTRS